jgi:predicted transcriptional regulator
MSAPPNAKTQVRQVLDRLPDDCSLEDVQYHLYVAEKLRQRLAQADAGQAVPQSEAEKRLDKWLIK